LQELVEEAECVLVEVSVSLHTIEVPEGEHQQLDEAGVAVSIVELFKDLLLVRACNREQAQ